MATLLTCDLPASPDAWRELREERGITIGELAALTALDRQTVRKLEEGGRVSLSTRRLVGAALGVVVFGVGE